MLIFNGVFFRFIFGIKGGIYYIIGVEYNEEGKFSEFVLNR